MGNDGGSIPDRRDLVKTKPKAEQADKANQVRARWFFCALSKRLLQEPIVSCALGKLYNKDALLEYLLDKSAYGDGEKICGHIKSLKDVKTLKLTHNTSPKLSSADSDKEPRGTDRAQFICPLTLKEMNGSHTFVYLHPCGCVFSQAGLKAVTGSGSTNGSGSTPPSDASNSGSEDKGEARKILEICPQCATKYDKKEDVIVINPDSEKEAEMHVAMELRRAKAAISKKSKKRKAAEEAVHDTALAAPDTQKKAKYSPSPAPTMNSSLTATSRAVASSLAVEEAKRKAGMSDAVKSLYEPKFKDASKKETFMTRATFTRYA